MTSSAISLSKSWRGWTRKLYSKIVFFLSTWTQADSNLAVCALDRSWRSSLGGLLITPCMTPPKPFEMLREAAMKWATCCAMA